MSKHEVLDDDDEEEYVPHPFERVEVKPGEWAEVDVEMIHLVKWLNSIPSVKTQFCCQGTEDEDDQPYLTLTCNDLMDLEEIIRFISPDAFGEFSVYGHHVRFTFRWHYKAKLYQTLDRLADILKTT